MREEHLDMYLSIPRKSVPVVPRKARNEKEEEKKESIRRGFLLENIL